MQGGTPFHDLPVGLLSGGAVVGAVEIPVHSGWIDVPGGRLRYDEAGTGPPIVWIHAAVADRRMWEREFRANARKHRVIRFDARGLGESPAATDAYSDVQDLEALFAELKVDPALVVGCSNGGRLAIDFALEHPARVRSLLLIAPGLSGWGPEMDPEGQPVYEADMARSGEIVRLWKERKPKEAVDRLREYWGASIPDSRRPLVELMMRENAAEIFSDASQRHNQSIVPPAAGRLSSVHQPTIILFGDRDEPTMGYIVGRVARGIPGAKLVRVQGGDHLINLSRPEAMDAALQTLLAGPVAPR